MPQQSSAMTAPQDADAMHPNMHPNGAIVIDMHADTAQRLVDEEVNLDERLPDGHVDAVRMREGGLSAQFFAIWVEPQFYGSRGPQAIERADRQIAAVQRLAENSPHIWQMAVSPADIRRAAAAGRLAALMGLEGGYAIDERLENVGRYYQMGVRYMSPVWTVSTSWAGSSGDLVGQTRGLNEFGKEVIREMNRLGMMIDVSHVSDKTFWDIINASTQPVIATHSGVRAVADVTRNLDDDQLRALAETGGVCCVIFYPSFLDPDWHKAKEAVEREIRPLVQQAASSATGNESQKRMLGDRVREREYARRLPKISLSRVADHIDHIVRLVGADRVGIGSDFDGIQATPHDLASVADLPNLSTELRRRGYAATDIAKILGGNILRVMEQVETLNTTP